MERNVVSVGIGHKTIVFAVTTSDSLMLLGQIPQALASEGWRVCVVANLNGEAKELSFPNLEMYHVGMRREPHVLADLFSLFSMIRLLAKLNPDIVSAGTPKASLVCLIAAWVTRVPQRIYMLRGLRSETLGPARRMLFNLLEAFMCFLSTRVISVSSSLADEFRSIRGVDSRKVVLLGRGASKGVDVDFFRPILESERKTSPLRAENGLAQSVPIVGFVGRITEDKGVYTLRGASELLGNSGISHQILLVGPDELIGEKLEDFLAGFHSPVRWLGQLDDVRAVYGIMDCLCLPTFREGFPNVVLEAQASGVPVITTDATGARDSVRDGVTGLIARKGDQVDLSRQLTRMLGDSGLREEIARKARAEVAKYFSSTIVTQSNLDFYSSLRLRQ